jgi:methyl-accepting chemotaxis protein
MKKSLFTIQRLMIVFGLIIAGLMAFLGIQTYSSFSDIRIGSPTYDVIVKDKDLIADILPPPLYPAEPFAYAHIIEGEPALLSKLTARLNQIQSDYKTRLEYWKERLTSLNVMSDQEAASFLQEIENRNERFWTSF